MTASTPTNLTHSIEWIKKTDHHAEHRLDLIEKVEAMLDGDASAADRNGLAEQLDRWRYQLRNEHRGKLSKQDQALVDELDLHANQLRDGKARSPRQPLKAIRGTLLDSPAIASLSAWFDSDYPLVQLTAEAKRITDEHFTVSEAENSEAKRRMVVYAPVYVSSQCVNHCTYCGFRYPMQINRTHLELDQVVQQSQILKRRGFEHQLIVAGDYPSRTSTGYFCELINGLDQDGLQVGIEIAAQSTQSYAAMVEAGAKSVTLYQETYDEAVYETVHIRGPKASFHWRLEAPERAAEAGISRVGVGVLLGLADPVKDVTAMLRHAAYLKDRFPDLKLAISLPRIHEAPDNFSIPYKISDEMLVRMYCICRLAFPDAELVLSTREPAKLRGELARICITQMSAGSSTAPGGYSEQEEACLGEQFPVTDERSVDEVVQWLTDEGFKVMWSCPSS
ncbi:2-iminoacetate synthase [Planctomycetes bacterium CA13]|uniref:2-iminoacetate synthase n=1 Tax=Novipirellula herctigrandis TaxID=2527986 RepID=A0A5C5YN32_9BACT|nr:2-iminoacetate synthase [Planctomycetes bacterium CA13]